MKTKTYVFIFLLILGFGVFANVITAPFIYDDHGFVEKNSLVITLHSLKDYFLTNVGSGQTMFTSGLYNYENQYYRPLQVLLHAIVFRISPNPPLFHIIQILIHVINAFLVFLFARKLTLSQNGAIICSVFFLLHPVQIESVSFISGLAEPLAFMFVFLALLLYLNINKKPVLYSFLSYALYIAALFSKENAVIFFPLALLVTIFVISKKNKSNYITLGIYFLITVLYLTFRFHILPFETNVWSGYENLYATSIWVRLLTFITNLTNYAALIIYPFNLYYEKPFYYYVGFNDYKTWMGFLIAAISFFGIFYFYKKEENAESQKNLLPLSKTISFSIVWFFICLAPYSGIIPMTKTWLEHWLYFPLFGIALIVGIFYDKISFFDSKWKKIFIAIFVFIISIYCIRDITRNNDWRNEEKFFINEIKHASNQERPYINLSFFYLEKQNYTAAEQTAQSGILKSTMNRHVLFHNLAVAQYFLGNKSECEKNLYNALHIRPDYIPSINALYDFYTREGNTIQAIKCYNLLKSSHEKYNPTAKDISEIEP